MLPLLNFCNLRNAIIMATHKCRLWTKAKSQILKPNAIQNADSIKLNCIYRQLVEKKEDENVEGKINMGVNHNYNIIKGHQLNVFKS